MNNGHGVGGRLAASVVIPSYNRGPALAALLEQFAAQSIDKSTFEVIVVDDGSKVDPRPGLPSFEGRLALHVERQENGGAARARQKGAELARGEILVFLDDDMQIGPGFVAAHLAAHKEHARSAVLGRLRALASIDSMPLFERYYARMLDRLAEQSNEVGARGDEGLPGPKLYTGNMSIPRALFFEAGGFDPQFRLLEDVELGIRLERVGGRIFFSSEAEAVHGSDHVSTARWLDRSLRDGVYATKVAHKHPDYAAASPFWHVSKINPLSKPILALSMALPGVGEVIARTGMGALEAADKVGLAKVAVKGTTLVYGIQFYRGVRQETGALGDVVREYRAWARAVGSVTDGSSVESKKLVESIRADHVALQKSQGKYGIDRAPRSLGVEVVNNIGLQVLAAYRVMRALHEAGHAVAAKVMSRLIRHAYGSDIHWEADFAPGVVIVHGFGLAIAKGVRVGEGCILFQGVTLGIGRDGKSGNTGAPTLERDVHVGVGATLVGPITVGRESKIMAGCTVTQSIPARSLVEAPQPAIRAR
jgi:serine acetyltransferase/GT2 family glycosyltransferase